MALATVTSPKDEAERTRFQDELVGLATDTLRLYAMHLGHRLGYWIALARRPLTYTELADETRTHPRYTMEWLEHQAVTGVLEVEDPAGPAENRRYRLSPGRAGVLAEPESLEYLAPLIQTAVGATRPIDEVESAYRQGGGVPFSEYGVHMREGQAGMNRTMFLHLMGTEWIPAMPDVHAALSRGSARVADIGAGAAWSSIAIAQHYPGVRVDAFDLDDASVALAKENVAHTGLQDRIQVHHADASDPALDGSYELVTAFECLHDMSRPVDALRTMRRLVQDDGTVLVMDERVEDRFDPSGPGTEPLMYGWSVLHCLPAGMADAPSAATGTLLRRATLERHAEQAGFRSVEVLPIENAFFRFYRLRV